MRGGLSRATSLLLLAATVSWGCGAARMEPPKPAPEAATGRIEVGLASWYGEAHHGLLTASGERFDMMQLTAAHRTLPMGTLLRVRNLENGRLVRVRINDRGPYIGGRILDLSYRAARALGMVEQGVARVQLHIVGAD